MFHLSRYHHKLQNPKRRSRFLKRHTGEHTYHHTVDCRHPGQSQTQAHLVVDVFNIGDINRVCGWRGKDSKSALKLKFRLFESGMYTIIMSGVNRTTRRERQMFGDLLDLFYGTTNVWWERSEVKQQDTSVYLEGRACHSCFGSPRLDTCKHSPSCFGWNRSTGRWPGACKIKHFKSLIAEGSAVRETHPRSFNV